MKKAHSLLALLILVLTSFSCKKSNNSSSSSPSTNIKYTVQVISGNGLAALRTTSGQSSQDGLSGAVVSTNQEGTIQTVTTDATGLATFSLNSGVVAVTVSAPDHTGLNYLAQLSGGPYNSTMALLFPTSGSGTSTISGNVYATLDETSTSTIQYAPDGTGINAYIDASSAENYVNVSTGQGIILKAAYQGAAYKTTVSNGSFTITVPAFANGLPIIVQGDDFSYNVKVGPATFERRVFSGIASSPILCKSGKKEIYDINY